MANLSHALEKVKCRITLAKLIRYVCKSNCASARFSLFIAYLFRIFIIYSLEPTIEINFIQETSSKTTAAHRAEVCPVPQLVFESFNYACGCEFLLPIQLLID